jgi:hypothetical protein
VVSTRWATKRARRSAGVASELLGKLRRLDAVTPPIRHRGVFVIFDPEAVKRSLDELCAEAGVEVFLHAFVGAATSDGDRIIEIAFQDHGGLHRLSASSFVDASGDCDLACFAGASTRYGQSLDGQSRDSWHPFRRHSARRGRHDRAVGVGNRRREGARRESLSKDRSVISAAERRGRQQAWIYLDILRSLPGCDKAYLVSTGPDFGTRESRHVNAVYQLT